ncbi:hypothetical protein J532_4321, partial [Acinetobacter baumannii 940793]
MTSQMNVQSHIAMSSFDVLYAEGETAPKMMSIG